MQERIYHILTQKDEVTWQTVIHELVKTEQMDPWDIDISKLAKRYMETLKVLQEHSFSISGKMILASAILLKLKAAKLVDEHIAGFDSLLFSKDEDLLDDGDNDSMPLPDVPNLLIKTPQARKRKVNLNDLMNALEQALKVEEKRLIRNDGTRLIREVKLPDASKVDITALIADVYKKVREWFLKRGKLTFSELVPSQQKNDKILTFIPLLHLSNQQKVDLDQKIAFGEIDIYLMEAKQHVDAVENKDQAVKED